MPRRSRAEAGVELVLRRSPSRRTKPISGLKLLADREALRREAVAVAVVVELRAVARVVRRRGLASVVFAQ